MPVLPHPWLKDCLTKAKQNNTLHTFSSSFQKQSFLVTENLFSKPLSVLSVSSRVICNGSSSKPGLSGSWFKAEAGWDGPGKCIRQGEGAPKQTHTADAEVGVQSWLSGELLVRGHECVSVCHGKALPWKERGYLPPNRDWADYI